MSSNRALNMKMLATYKDRIVATKKFPIALVMFLNNGASLFCIHKAFYTVGYKNLALYICPYLHQLLTNFENFFTGTFGGQFAII